MKHYYNYTTKPEESQGVEAREEGVKLQDTEGILVNCDKNYVASHGSVKTA